MSGRRTTPSYWHVVVAVLAMVAIFGTVSGVYSPRLGITFVVVALATLGAVVYARRQQLHVLHSTLTTVLMALLTLALVVSVAGIVVQVIDDKMLKQWIGEPLSAGGLLGVAAVIWIFNVLLFAFWYWELDAGGPLARHGSTPYRSRDLVFPQRQHAGDDDWIPEFVDYLFFAFNSSTAFSPTDTLVLSRKIKLLMMIQALVSLAVLAVIAARAVNALAGP